MRFLPERVFNLKEIYAVPDFRTKRITVYNELGVEDNQSSSYLSSQWKLDEVEQMKTERIEKEKEEISIIIKSQWEKIMRNLLTTSDIRFSKVTFQEDSHGSDKTYEVRLFLSNPMIQGTSSLSQVLNRFQKDFEQVLAKSHK